MPMVPLGPITGVRPEGVDPVSVVVTADTPEQIRRWQVLLSSKELRVLRDNEHPSYGPVISVHIETHDVWISWVCPAPDMPALRRSIQNHWEQSELWLDQNGRQERHVSLHHAWERMLSGLADHGYTMVTKPGDIRWLEFTRRDEHVDWRIKADIVAELVWRASAGV